MPSSNAQSCAFADIDAIEQAALIARGEVSAREIMLAAIARAEACGPYLNCFTATNFEAALAQADGTISGPLGGVPFAVKDVIDIPGWATRSGSRSTSYLPKATGSDFTRQCEEAGLITIGKTSTPEFGLLPTTEPYLGGPTINPWCTSRSPGGSSGGSAVAVSAGIVPIAHASDGGGSIRIPASHCGVFGLKLSRGRHANTGRTAPGDVASEHCLSRTVRDTALFLSLMQDRNAPAQLRKIDYIQSKTSRRLKIGLCMRSYDGHTPHPDISDRVLAMAKLCDELGHHVEEAEWRINADHLRRSFVVNWESAAAAIVRKTEEALGCYPGTAVLEPWTLGLAERFFCEHVNELGAAQRYFVEAADEFRRMFAPYDALLCPVTPDLQPLLGAVSPDRPFDELEATAFRHCAYTLPANVFGCPAVSIPSGFSQDGILPIGSQFFADVGREDVLLHLAYEIEEAAPWKRLPSLTMSLMGLAV